jgi:hypothetical protein
LCAVPPARRAERLTLIALPMPTPASQPHSCALRLDARAISDRRGPHHRFRRCVRSAPCDRVGDIGAARCCHCRTIATPHASDRPGVGTRSDVRTRLPAPRPALPLCAELEHEPVLVLIASRWRPHQSGSPRRAESAIASERTRLLRRPVVPATQPLLDQSGSVVRSTIRWLRAPSWSDRGVRRYRPSAEQQLSLRPVNRARSRVRNEGRSTTTCSVAPSTQPC